MIDLVKKWGIGLTGGVATGKSTVARMLESRSYTVIDADDLARQAVRPGTTCLDAIVKHFGPRILAHDGTLNRKAMADIIFNHSSERKTLEAIIHPEIHRLFKVRLSTLGLFNTQRPFFYEAALLFESEKTEQFAQVWVTFCSEATQLQRLRQSRKMDEATARALLNSQWPAAEKAKKADVVINTDCGIPEVELQVAQALRSWQTLQNPQTTR